MTDGVGQHFDRRVAVVETPSAEYPDPAAGEEAAGHVARALARAARELGWADEERGPFGKIVPQGARVLVKPNLVTHRNQGPWGVEPLVTHASLIRAAVEGALRAGASEVLVGDAPIQSCDFDELLSVNGLGAWAEELAGREPRFKGVRDFRRTTCFFRDGVRIADENRRAVDEFILFDLGRESLLEEITDDAAPFRVTCYDPRLMARTHAAGRHQYLVAREVVEADVVLNLPKLKTHKKAGVTCALKNLIGINGNKEYLPHHRVGGATRGGDCYPGGSRVKRVLEYVSDRQNLTSSEAAGRLWGGVAAQLGRVLRLTGDRLGTEGSWSGNDTVWRTGLDLNRVILYGRRDGTMADEPQRRVLQIVDAVVAGQGDGPLSPQPLPMGLIFAGQNPAAVDWVGALLLGYDPSRIAIAREAFGSFRWPVASFASDGVEVLGDLGRGAADRMLAEAAGNARVIYPAGWRDAAAKKKEGPVGPAAGRGGDAGELSNSRA